HRLLEWAHGQGADRQLALAQRLIRIDFAEHANLADHPVLAAAAAYASGKGMLTIRKAGKLPREVYRDEYTLEYGTSCLEVHKDEIAPGTRVLILDDVLATGGTVGSAVRLLEQTGARIAGVGVVLELDGLEGRAKLPGHKVLSLQVVHS
ncbi:adenine phosphoribosyltransferase, partial [Glutamicibacter sp.]|uniref:adenine phosphoribosyltransferase n=1 Tax=Glutamicibacter sp. TaxID=1931995 RepID=UPI002FC7A8EE